MYVCSFDDNNYARKFSMCQKIVIIIGLKLPGLVVDIKKNFNVTSHIPDHKTKN